MQIIRKYFDLTPDQEQQFAALGTLYPEWNAKINVISRRDIDNLYERHILHSLAIERILHFQPGTNVLDVGTGGGFPGIPLAILLPQVHFVLVDSVKKKLLVASEVAKAIGLSNVEFRWERVEDEKQKFDFVVSRAVMPLPDLVKLVSKNIEHKAPHNALPNGLIVLKGGELDAEIAPFHQKAEVTPLASFFDEEFFTTKSAIYLPL